VVTAVWGDAPLVDDIHSCRMPQPTGAEAPAVATSTGDHPLWRDVKEVEAALDAAGETVERPVPDTHPRRRDGKRRDAIVNVRPTTCRLWPRRCG